MDFFSGINTQETTFESGGGDLAPIPKGTSVLAVAEEATNAEYQGDRYINVKWRISKPEEYSNRVIYQKIRVYDTDTAKAERAKRMLAAIATNAGGKLFQAMQQAQESEPSDMSLTHIAHKPMVLKLDVWELDGKTGNWVQAVSPYARQAAQQPAPAPAPVAPQAPTGAPTFEDDIPFMRLSSFI